MTTSARRGRVLVELKQCPSFQAEDLLGLSGLSPPQSREQRGSSWGQDGL